MVQELTWILDHAAHVPSTLSLIEMPQPISPATVVPSHSQLGPKLTGNVVGIYNTIASAALSPTLL